MKKKLLIIRFSSIGDIVLTTPVIRCLKNQLGNNTEIHYLTKSKFANILHNNPYIDNIIELKDSLNDILPILKNQKYDHIIDLHSSLRSSIVKFRLNRPSHSFKKLNFRKWLLVNFKLNYMPDIHIVDRYLKTVEFLNVKYDGKGLNYFYGDSDKIITKNIGLDSKYIAIAIGGNHYTKKMPVEKIISICRKVDFPIILMGGKEDKPEAENILSSSKKENIINGCGEFTLNQSASIIDQSKAVITNDTGLMHIASAFKKPIASVWGNTVPEFGMYPFYPENTGREISKIIEIKDLSCRPCSKIGFKKCPKKHFKCMKDIDENQIVAFINKYI